MTFTREDEEIITKLETDYFKLDGAFQGISRMDEMTANGLLQRYRKCGGWNSENFGMISKSYENQSDFERKYKYLYFNSEQFCSNAQLY